MPISKKRQREIIDLATPGVPPDTPEELWNDDEALAPLIRRADRKRSRWLANHTNAQELHLFAQNWHWDGGGGKPLQKLVANPHCDAGTMLLLFWYGCAEDYYFQFDTIRRITGEHDREIFRLLRQIERKISKSEYGSANIFFDPAPHVSMLDRREEFSRQIPECMYCPIGRRKRKP